MSNNNIKTIDEEIGVAKAGKDQNIIIIDPNRVNDPNTNVLTERYVKQENFILYANLKIIKKPSTTIIYDINNNSKNVINENELIINMLNPIDSISKDNTIKYKNDLTVDYTDYFTTNSLNNNNSANIGFNGELKNFFDPETFGITNISISQNASFKPMVTIEFTDVQGKTLFESGDHPNNPYNFFYSFPYPTFILSVKGFYGKTIDYPLVLMKTSTKFDPESGSYKITAEFLSRTFSIYNSFLLIYAYIAPFMFKTNDESYLGDDILKQIYDQQNSYYSKIYSNDPDSLKRYTFKSGIYPKLLDIQRIKNSLKNSTDDQEITANKNLILELDSSTLIIKEKYEYIISTTTPTDDNKDLLLGNLEQINLAIRNISNDEVLVKIINEMKFNNSKFYDDSDKSLKPNIIEANNIQYLRTIVTKILDVIDTYKTMINEKIVNKQLINISDQIGYMPNVYNISRIIFNNIQTFLILMNIAYKKAVYQIKNDKDDANNKRITFHDLFGEYTKTEVGNKGYEPFPNYFIKEKNQKDDNTSYKKTYPGYHVENKGWAEVKFIDEIYDAIDRIKTILTPSKKDVKTDRETFTFSNFEIKTDSIDAYTSSSSYITSMTSMIERFQLYNVYSGNVFRTINEDNLNTIIKSLVDSEYDYFSHIVLNKLDNSKQISYLNDLKTLINDTRPYDTIVGSLTKNLKANELQSLKTEITNDITKHNGKNIDNILKKYKLNKSVVSRLSDSKSQLYDNVNETKIIPLYLFDENAILDKYYLTDTVPTYFSDADNKLKTITTQLNKNNKTYLFGDRFNKIIISGATSENSTVINPFKYDQAIKNYGGNYKTLTLTINDIETLKKLIGFDPSASTLTSNNSTKNNY